MENPNNYQYQQLKSQKGGGSGRGSSQGKIRSSSSKPTKVKYISSPMMVWASNASEFRAIVQGLTGQNSDVVRSRLEEATATGMGMAIINSSADDGVVGGLQQRQRITTTAAAATNAAAVINVMDPHEYVHDGTDRILPSCTQHGHLNEASFWRELASETLSGFNSQTFFCN